MPSMPLGWVTNGSDEEGATADQANNKITIDRAGKWLVNLHLSISGTASVTFDFEIRYDAVLTGFKTRTRMGLTGDVQNVSLSAIVDADGSSEDLEVYVNGDGSSDSVTPEQGQLIVTRIGE